MIEIVALLIISLVIFNIAPFVLSDTFGHYYRTHTHRYVTGKQNYKGDWTIETKTFIDAIKEECNPWLMWWQDILHLPLVNMKPNTSSISYSSDEVARIYKEINNV